ncbi:hypothetical protein [Gallibacterium sp. AGMB14963]|uniref:hypothetical protein n=1 Tax=Gallibacterium faecale TaxID=3019086 RepID=UPI0022F1871B|nr:hypothetical protein [Gallibacterium sp. AGMB14963]MDA3977926.1 hypothetical protein [Gallibacterium sp. AGMB14963]
MKINQQRKEKGFEGLNDVRNLMELINDHVADNEFDEAVYLLRKVREMLIEAEVNFKFVHLA